MTSYAQDHKLTLMAPTPRLSAAGLRAGIIAAVLALAALIMVIVGWTETHVWQSVLLQASWLVFDAAVFVIVWHLIRARGLLPARTARFQICWWMLLGGVGAGLLLYLVALITRHAMLTPLGQMFIAIGLGAMCCYLAATSIGRPSESGLEQLPELDELMGRRDDHVDGAEGAR